MSTDAMKVLSFAALVLAAAMTGSPAAAHADMLAVRPGSYPAIATVDRRFQSYNIEMAQVIGGRFWAPYPSEPATSGAKPDSAANSVDKLFVERQPIDLANRRLRNLARALGPAYLRVSGTWANTVYFQDDGGPRMAAPPKGFQGVLTRAQWAGVIGFAKAVDARLMVSFPVSDGARDATGLWSPVEARKLLRFTRALGGRIDAAELVNEPNLPSGLPANYNGARYARDMAIFRDFAAREAQGMKVVGPGSAGETGAQLLSRVTTEQLLSGEPRPRFDVFSYHFYGARSERCARMLNGTPRDPNDALGEAWLGQTETAFAFSKRLQERFVPGVPIWLSETAQASCGGDRWASTFLDTFRYVDQMGRLAKQGVSAVFHNTLSATDYGLIDAEGTSPRPSYWAGVLWRRLMGTRVLDAGASQPGLHVYAHCLAGWRGGVALVAINLDRETHRSLDLPAPARRYTLTADVLAGKSVKLNDNVIEMLPSDRLPPLNPIDARGTAMLPPASITFLAFPGVANPACN